MRGRMRGDVRETENVRKVRWRFAEVRVDGKENWW